MREKSRITIHSFAALLLLISVSLSASIDFDIAKTDIAKITYLSFNRTGVSPLPPQRLQKALSIVRSDDSPFSRIKLPWAFNFFGNKIYNMFVDPNGALHQNYNLTFGRMGNPQVTNVSHFGVIAGYLTDLYPGNATKTANITSYMFQDVVTITFSKVPVYDKATDVVSFRISIYNDSRIVIDYDKVYASPKYVSGLRAPLTSNNTLITRSQILRGKRDWFTYVKGIYPRKDSVTSGNQFVACPISRVWGAYPKTVQLATGSKLITLYPLHFSCRKDLDIAINFDATFDPKSSVLTAKCVYQLTLTSPTLVCDLSALNLVEGSSYGQLIWRVAGSGTLYGRMPVNSILFTFAKGAPSSLDYSMNVEIPPRCTAKHLSTSNYSCLNLPCTKTIPVLYQNPICGTVNTTKLLKLDSCSRDLAYDKRKECCPIEKLDCEGICNGQSQVGIAKLKNSNTTKVCCIFPQLVDCFGVCDGKVIRDACAVCGGKNLNGIGCNTGVFLTAPNKNNTLFPKFDYSQSKILWKELNVSIANENNVPVSVNVSTGVPIEGVGPDITLSSTNFTLAPKASKTVVVNVSVARIYSQADYSWQVKAVTFYYFRGTGEDQYRYVVDVYPAASNCSSIKNVDSCMRVPACIMCATYSSIRVLKAVEDEDGDYWDAEDSISAGNQTLSEFEEFIGEGGAEEARYYRRRKLYTGLVPLALGVFTDPVLTGVCRNGFYTNVCANAMYSSAAVPVTSFSYFPFIISGLLFWTILIW